MVLAEEVLSQKKRRKNLCGLAYCYYFVPREHTSRIEDRPVLDSASVEYNVQCSHYKTTASTVSDVESVHPNCSAAKDVRASPKREGTSCNMLYAEACDGLAYSLQQGM